MNFSSEVLKRAMVEPFLKKICERLLNKPYINGVILREQNLSSKYCQSLGQKLCKQLGLDLLKDALWVFVGQRAAKLQAIKIGGLKKILVLDQS